MAEGTVLGTINQSSFTDGRRESGRGVTSREFLANCPDKIASLFRYWDERRGGRRMPSRGDIDPLDIPQLLQHLILLDTDERIEDFRYRLYGTAVAEGFGEERTGKTFAELKRIDNIDEAWAGYRSVQADGEPHYSPDRTVLPLRHYTSYSRLLLPLSDDDRRVNMILGGIVFFEN